jgi:hypothetical protein
MNNNYKNLYLKYKSKYLTLKSSFNQRGGEESSSYVSNIEKYLEDINGMREKMEILINKIKEIEPEFLSKNIYLWGNNINQPAYEYVKNIKDVIDKFTIYLESNDIPIDYYNLDIFYTQEFVNSLESMKNDLTYDKLIEKYKSRQYFYTIDEANYNEILDAMILEFNINNEKDIEKLFRSALLGFNKNYIFGYMVLFRFLIVNKKQLSVINNNISYLTFHSIFSSLNNSLNSEEYVGILIKLIKEYIMSFPIKKLIIIKNPIDFNKKFELKSEVTFYESNLKIDLINSYDAKNNLIIYKSGHIKSVDRIILDDLKQIIYTLVRIPVYKSNL